MACWLISRRVLHFDWWNVIKLMPIRRLSRIVPFEQIIIMWCWLIYNEKLFSKSDSFNYFIPSAQFIKQTLHRIAHCILLYTYCILFNFCAQCFQSLQRTINNICSRVRLIVRARRMTTRVWLHNAQQSSAGAGGKKIACSTLNLQHKRFRSISRRSTFHNFRAWDILKLKNLSKTLEASTRRSQTDANINAHADAQHTPDRQTDGRKMRGTFKASQLPTSKTSSFSRLCKAKYMNVYRCDGVTVADLREGIISRYMCDWLHI